MSANTVMNETPVAATNNWSRFLYPIAIFVAVFAAFAPALSAQFVAWDDDRNFVTNQAWRGLSAKHVGWMLTTFWMGPYQPLSWMSLGAEYPLWGMDARGYHATNVLIHALTAIAFWFVARRLIRVARGVDSPLGALAAALVFALHPLRVESVAWVTERRDVLSGLFFVLAIGAWLRFAAEERRSWYLGTILLVLLSLLSKASAIVMPAVLLALDVWPLKRTLLGWPRLLLEKVPFFVLSVVFGVLAIHGQRSSGDNLLSLARYGPLQRAAQVAFGLVWYPFRTLLPRNLIPIHEIPDPFDVTSMRFIVPIVIVLAAIVVLVALRKRAPALVAAAACFVILVSPVIGITQAGPQLVADRYSYFACMPFALLAGCFVTWSLVEHPHSRTLVVSMIIAVAATLGALTFRQARYWHDSESLWRRTLAINPKSSVAIGNLAGVLVNNGVDARDPIERDRNWDAAQHMLEEGLSRRDDPQMHVGLARIQLMRAKVNLDRRLPLSADALAHVDHAIEIGTARGRVEPDWKLARASALMAAGRCPEAVTILAELEDSAPFTPSLERTLSLALDCMGNKSAAYAHVLAALRIERDDAELLLRAGDLALSLGSPADARDHFQRALDLREHDLGPAARDDPQWQSARAALDRLH
jgi:tetratricopeptide (TPR) repeat protein